MDMQISVGLLDPLEHETKQPYNALIKKNVSWIEEISI
jgi:hypothetical protein